MNKEELRKRTWKYFFEQKAEEIERFFLWIILIIVSLGLGNVIYYLGGGEWSAEIPSLFWIFIFQSILGLFALIGILGSIVAVIFILEGIFIHIRDWIKNNWKKAEERAKEDLK